MNHLPVALQIYSVRDFAEKDFAGTMRAVKAAGYDYVEFGGLYNLSPAEIKATLADCGLQPISAHVSIQELMADAPGTVGKYAEIGCQYIAIPYLTEDMRPGKPGFDTLLENIKTIGEVCNQHGITLLYHNHEFEFEKMPDGTFGLDYLYAQVPASLLQTQIDTCWVRFAGQDPAAYIRKYAGRCPVVHLKDYYKEGEAEGVYELIGLAEKKKSRGNFQFRPVGHGVQDMPAILKAALESGAKWVVVEQDSSVGRTSLEAAQISREYLKSQGW